MRGGELFWDFRTFNPPISKLNWANEYAEKAELRDNTLVTRNTYLDVPVAWLGQQFFEEAEELRQTNERAYIHEYLGQAIGTGGDVFPNVSDMDMDVEVDNGGNPCPMWQTFDHIYNGIDWGYARDPFRFVKCHFDAKKLDLYIYREYNTLRARNEDVFHVLYDELKLIDRDEQVIADSAEEKSIADFKAYGAFIRGAEKGPNSRRYSMKWLQGLNHIYIDKRHCPETYWEFVNYEYEQDRDGNFLSNYPDGNDHGIDACIRHNVEISTPLGNIPIEKLQSDGLVYAYDVTSARVVETRYTNCRITYMSAEIWNVELEDGLVVECTYDHKILTSNRGYVRAFELNHLDSVVTTDWDVRVTNIWRTGVYDTVYDLEVPEYHNFVLGNGVVVHNCRYALNKYWARKGN